MIVTRQNMSNKEVIQNVLKSAGLGHVQVTCLGGQSRENKRTKAEVMLPIIKELEGMAVFLDDSHQELLDAMLCADTKLIRVLCAPADWRPVCLTN